MQRVGAKKSKGGRPKKNPDTVSEFPSTLPAVAKTLGLDERTARRHVQAAEDYQAAAPEQQARVDAGEFGRWFSDHEQPNDGAFPFSRKWAHRLMTITSNPAVANVHHGGHLPTDLNTVYELATMTAPALEAAIDSETASQDAPGSTIAPGYDP